MSLISLFGVGCAGSPAGYAVSRQGVPIDSQKNDQKVGILAQIVRGNWRFVDTTDHKLLSLLRENARMPVAAMAKALGVSRGTVQNRLARLEADGTVLGHTVRLKHTADDQRIRAFMTVA